MRTSSRFCSSYLKYGFHQILHRQLCRYNGARSGRLIQFIDICYSQKSQPFAFATIQSVQCMSILCSSPMLPAERYVKERNAEARWDIDILCPFLSNPIIILFICNYMYLFGWVGSWFHQELQHPWVCKSQNMSKSYAQLHSSMIIDGLYEFCSFSSYSTLSVPLSLSLSLSFLKICHSSNGYSRWIDREPTCTVFHSASQHRRVRQKSTLRAAAHLKHRRVRERRQVTGLPHRIKQETKFKPICEKEWQCLFFQLIYLNFSPVCKPFFYRMSSKHPANRIPTSITTQTCLGVPLFVTSL